MTFSVEISLSGDLPEYYLLLELLEAYMILLDKSDVLYRWKEYQVIHSTADSKMI
ncbi:predicted protein [Sclerotinia sclerotiorum 1980 UF-70]|uniref:Uncharacterized protein n=1 Tax=Sclerotinia sclerotiorum (strain ATCC 18683 / 1980 / Ss-1) TaxID=665079 RepID=A7ECP0_SCLS1|nr:predicted protein [Sclerotinia sclerotiorum 1980 UF-70]EDO00219.1 predicted protein [Sclerotinia sclerotiorum 1980 UF-70]